MENIHQALLFFIALIIALSVHEFGHAWVAWRLGDPTARQMGRVTLNPLNHLDPFGTVMIAVMAYAGIGIGWAKPVPVNPAYLSNPRKHLTMIAFAGPAMNLIQAFVTAGIWVGMIRFAVISPGVSTGPGALLFDGLQIFLSVNVGLFLFNMLPIYPLDGSKIISFFMPRALAFRFEKKMIELGAIPFYVLFGLEMLLGDRGMGPFSLILIPLMRFFINIIVAFWSILLNF